MNQQEAISNIERLISRYQDNGIQVQLQIETLKKMAKEDFSDITLEDFLKEDGVRIFQVLHPAPNAPTTVNEWINMLLSQSIDNERSILASIAELKEKVIALRAGERVDVALTLRDHREARLAELNAWLKSKDDSIG